MRVSSVEGHIIIDSEDDIIFRTGNIERARIDDNGNFSGFAVGGQTPLNPDLIATFTQPGTLASGAGVNRFPMPTAGTIVSVLAIVGTASTGQAILIDVNKNGTTIFTTQANRPTIAAAATISSVKTPDVTAFSLGDYLTVDIDQIGSGATGADLVVQVVYTLS